MFSWKTHIHTAAGTVIVADEAVTAQVRPDGVTAVYVQVHQVEERIHEDNGVCIELCPSVAVKRYMANYRCTQHWCKPFFGVDLKEIPEQTQVLILELEDGSYCAVVPVVNDTYKCVLEGGTGCIVARNCSWVDSLSACEGLSFVYAVGNNPQEIVGCCVTAVLELLQSDAKLRTQRCYPEIFEYLGWCSWDSMQIRVNEAGIVQKCEELRRKEIPVKWAIIDDMWAEIRDFYGKQYGDFQEMVRLMHSSRMYHLEADPIRFPNGLAHCVNRVKEYGLQVGMWYPATGYWKGIDPEGKAYPLLKEHLLLSKRDTYIPNWQESHARAYFEKIFDFFRQCDADFIKVDNQAIFYRQYKGFAPIGQMAKQFHDGMEAAAQEHFESRMINCMGMASENIWSRKSSPVSRCSDDFLPENKEWFTKHVLQCAYNSLLLGQLYWCDWDMWWTDDGQAVKNSLMRAISGGPIYVSDQLERSRGEVLKPLAMDNGRILRCDRPAVPTADCVTEDPTCSGKALKLQNMAGEHGVLAVLNLDEQARPVMARISGDLVDGFDAEEYAVYEHFSGTCRILRKGEEFTVTLQDDEDYRLYILAPVHDGFAVIGRTDKFISPKTIAAVHGSQVELKEAGPWAYVLDGKLHTVQ